MNLPYFGFSVLQKIPALSYEVHFTIIFPGSQVSDFTGNLRAQNLNKAQTKQANINSAKYNSQGSTGSGVNFVLSFLLMYIFSIYHLFPLSMTASIHRCCCNPPLKHRVWYDSQETLATAAILHLILWAVWLFVVLYFVWDGERAIASSIVAQLSRIPLYFPCPILSLLRLCLHRTHCTSSILPS